MSDTFTLKFKAELEGKNEVDEFFERGTRGADKFEARLKRAFKSTGAAISDFAGRAGSELQAFAGKELGGSLGSQARGVLDLRDAINKLAVSAGGGQEMVSGLKDEIQNISVASNQLQVDVTAAMQAFVERTGRIDIARKNMELYAKTATATSASLEDVARVGESLSSKFNITDQAKAFAILATQAKSGAIEMRDLATQGASIFTAAREAGIGGKGREEQGVREIGGFLQAVAGGARGKGKTTAADTAVQVAAIFSQIRQKSGAIEALGIGVSGRDYIDVIKDIIRAEGGDPLKLAKIFKNERAFRGVSTLARQFRETGNFSELDTLIGLGSDPSSLDRDFAIRRGTGAAKLRAQEISRQRFVDKYFGGVAELGASHATDLQLAALGLGIGGKGIGLLGNILGGKGGTGVGGAISSIAATPVRVVNWPGGFGVPGGDPATGAKGGVLGAAGKWALGLLAGVPGAAALPTAGLLGVGYLMHTQQERVKATEAAYNASNPVDPEAAKYLGTEYARGHKAIIRHGGMQMGDLGSLPPQVNITIHSNESLEVKGDSGTRDPKVIDRRGGGG
jgi:hypothetical protein